MRRADVRGWMAGLVLCLALAGCASDATPTVLAPVPPTATARTAPALPTPTLAPLHDSLPPPAPGSYDILDLPPPPADVRIPYGPDSQQFGDLRLPPGPGPYPVVVVIHGGYWQAQYNLDHIGQFCAALTRAGVATWSLEYRRLGDSGGGWPGTFADVAAGTDFLRTLAPRYKLDLSRVVAVGHSAGGQLALWLAGRARIQAGSPLHSADPLPVRGVVALAAVSDLQAGWDQRLGGGVVGDLLGGAPTAVPDHYAAASPRALLPLGVPQRLLHGTADPIVPFVLSQDYQAAASAAGDDAQLIPLPGAGHFELIDPRTPQWPTVRDAILGLLGQ